ncbi:STAS domain-containing protein [Jeotgalibacillus sp. R-1-5s-1]|uniref:STAS domain-containing protein n=1 Tax=Jeotgalibacillus sp. R-1-5s-1 TaxID=2555897 RepID=UPI00106DA282|nr:STAS domain-containing protein [Jeotgalibacillus sp. R-1-5s-1]TFD94445.1 STAS domain-containing protein [Jeotgalibacillus sp. R-1-5s-1]
MDEFERLRIENEALKSEIEDYKRMVKELSAPIIPSIVPNTILVPLNGTLNGERFLQIQQKVAEKIHQEDTSAVLIDFTGIDELDFDSSGEYQLLSNRMNDLVNVLKMMGAETIFVGFSPKLAQYLIQLNPTAFKETQVFSSFKAGLQYLLQKKNLKLTLQGE